MFSRMKFKILVILALLMIATALAIGFIFYTFRQYEPEFGGTFVRCSCEYLYKT